MFDILKELKTTFKSFSNCSSMNASSPDVSLAKAINKLLKYYKCTKEEKKGFQHVALMSLFPKLALAEKLTDLTKYVDVGVLKCVNNKFDYVCPTLAWYFIAELFVENEVQAFVSVDTLRSKILTGVFMHVSMQNRFSYKSSSRTFFNFLEFLIAKQNKHALLKTYIEKILPSEIFWPWVSSCAYANHFHLLQLLTTSNQAHTSTYLFSSDPCSFMIQAVKFADLSIVSMIAEQYVKEAGKQLLDGKLLGSHSSVYENKGFCTYTRSFLHEAVLEGNYVIVEYLLEIGFKDKLREPTMRDIVHHCLVDTNTLGDDQVSARKNMLTAIFQIDPTLINETNITTHFPSITRLLRPLQRPPILVLNIHVDLILHLIELGVDVFATDHNSNNILHLCPQYLSPKHYEKVVQALLDRGYSKIFHSVNKLKSTPLHAAIKHCEVLESTIELFSANKVDFNVVDKNKHTVLTQAIKCKRSASLLDALSRHGADVDKRTGLHNYTPLHFAAEVNNLTAVKYLIAKGCDVDATDKTQDTALHIALRFAKSESDIYEAVKVLIYNKANVNVVGYHHQTPLSIAMEGKEEGNIDNRILSLLKNAGAQ